MNPSTAFITSDAESLYLRLEKKLARKEAAFRQLVIVPNKLVGLAVERHLLHSGAFVGVKVAELSAAIDYLTRVVRFEDKKGHSFPAPMLFSLHLEALIGQLCEDPDPLFHPLREYIESEKSSFSRLKRVRDLAEGLSLDFLHYGVYGGKGLANWLKRRSWQVELWKKAFSLWDYPYHAFKELSEKKAVPMELDIHVFSFDAIPLLYEGFFAYLSQFFPFYTYFLTPSKTYWGEAFSEKELIYKKQGYEELGVSKNELIALKEYQKNEHPILINFATCSQKRLNFLLDQDLRKEEFFYEGDSPYTFLDYIKESLFEGRFCEEVVVLDEKDDSIKIHACPTKKREVEVMVKEVMKLMQGKQIQPSDVLVLAPDISVYEPYIAEAMKEQTAIPYQIFDLPIVSQSPLLSALWSLLCLLEERADKKEVFSFLHHACLLKKWELSFDELKIIVELAEKAGISWGIDETHRQQRLNSSYSVNGCWLHGFYKLLMSLIVTDDGFLTEQTALYRPYAQIEQQEAESVAKVFFCLKAVADLQQKWLFEKQPLQWWVNELKGCVESFFIVDEKDEGGKFFYQQLKGLEQLSLKVKKAAYSFCSIKRLFEKTLTKKGASQASKDQNAIVFASIDFQQLYPVKILYFLGMEEGSFPLKERLHPLREIDKEEMDPCPTATQEQRQLLVSAHLFAKKALYFSYCFFDDQDGKEKEISFLIKELFEIVQKQFTFLSADVMKKICVKHKAIAFHIDEIVKEGCFSFRETRLAQAYYHSMKRQRPLLRHFYSPGEVSHERAHVVKLDVKELEFFAKNPIKKYFQNTLSIHIKNNKNERESRNKEFCLSYLDKALYQREGVKQSFEEATLKFKTSPSYPLGLFADMALRHLEEEKVEIEALFEKLGLEPEQLFTIHLSEKAEKKEKISEKVYVVPAIKVADENKRECTIFGKIENVSPKGLLSFSEGSFADYVKLWPTFLVFLLVLQRYFSNEIAPELLCIKKQKVKKAPEGELQRALLDYIEYYSKGLHTPSPLQPDWAQSLLCGDLKEKKEEIYSAFTGARKNGFMDEYQKWVYAHMEPFSVEAIESNWDQEMKEKLASLRKWSLQKEIYG